MLGGKQPAPAGRYFLRIEMPIDEQRSRTLEADIEFMFGGPEASTVTYPALPPHAGLTLSYEPAGATAGVTM
jgi:hypothetical protein